jgi:hypothetical protein
MRIFLEWRTRVGTARRHSGIASQFESGLHPQTVIVLKEEERGILIVDYEANVSQIQFNFPARQEVLVKIAFRDFNFDQIDHEWPPKSLGPIIPSPSEKCQATNERAFDTGG